MRVLHHYWLSSGSRFCRLMLAERKLDALQKLELPWDAQSAFLAVNPAGTVPVLVEDDSTVLSGVWPICEYFEDISPEGSLLPGTPAARAEARRLVDWFHGKFEREVVGPVLKEKHFRRVTGDGVPSSQSSALRWGTLHLTWNISTFSPNGGNGWPETNCLWRISMPRRRCRCLISSAIFSGRTGLRPRHGIHASNQGRLSVLFWPTVSPG